MLKAVTSGILSRSLLSQVGINTRPPVRYKKPLPSHRKPSPCDVCLLPKDQKPCFDIRNVIVDRGNQCHAKFIRSFLYNHYWPREPTVVALWMCLTSQYLDVLTDKYAHSGDRFIAYEKIPRTGERKMIGVLVANKLFPWHADELEEWAHFTPSRPERHRMYFTAHTIRSPKLFTKYNLSFIYDVEVLTTASEVTAQGVGTLLLQHAIQNAYELRYPLVQVVATSQYTARICQKCGMKREWEMDYTDFVDDYGQRVFFPRRPHHKVAIYVKYYDPKIGAIVPCKPQLT